MLGCITKPIYDLPDTACTSPDAVSLQSGTKTTENISIFIPEVNV